ncbi:MAG: ATP-binding cassette domain-containing protein [Clostridia bacterium]|nr:ATP-binding cassette domain-containing protein [Clostridia bacterium]
MIEIQHLTKVFNDTDPPTTVLSDVSLTVADGEIFGIIGLSGAGKSTLVRCINLLETPTEGKVLIDGKDLTAMSRKDLLRTRRDIGMIFQSFNLFSQRSVRKNILYPLEISGTDRKEAAERAEELLRLVGLEGRGDAYPSQLSGGQKQRVAIARALATRPRYLLCDEATSALDPTTTASILDLLKEINRSMGVTVLIITHEMRVIDQICDRVAVIDRSRIAEVGRVTDVFSSPKSEIARQLILPSSPLAAAVRDGRSYVRIIFDEQTAGRPVLSDLILATGAPVSVAYADTKTIGTSSYGTMLLQLPEDGAQKESVLSWLRAQNIPFSEGVTAE